MREFFYARVSSQGQNLDRQLEVAKSLNISEDYIFVEKASGKDFKRPEYTLLKRMLREDDILYVKSIDRLGRNKQMILEEWKELTQDKKIKIVVTDMPILDTRKYDTGIENLISDIVLQLLSYMAEDERIRIRERQLEGINIAKEKGVKFGRKKISRPKEFEELYIKWKNKEITAKYFMDTVNLKRGTFYNMIKEYEEEL